MALTTQQIESVQAKAAKAAAIAKEAREKKVTKARKDELKAYFTEWMNEYHSESRPLMSVEKRAGFQYDAPSSVETDDASTMLMKSAKSYGSREEEVRDFHKLNDTLLIAYHNLRHAKGGLITSPTQLAAYQQFMKGESELSKALATTRTGFGAEWLVAQFSNSFIEEVESELVLADLHERIPMLQGVDKLDIGGGAAASTAFKISEATNDEASKIPTIDHGTRKVTLDPIDIGARELVSVQQHEDSAIAMAEYVRNRLIRAYRNGVETAILNGDTATTHQDSDVTIDKDARKLWDGYRKQMLAASKIDTNDTVDVANIRKVLQSMGNYGKPRVTVAVTNAVGWWKLSTLSEVLTVDKYGSMATILTGEVGNVLGVPIIWSDEVRQDLNESGVYDGVTTNETQIIFVYRDGYVSGIKREAGIESEKDIETQQIIYVVTGRMDFQAKYDTTTQNIVGQMYDINTAT